MAYWERGRADSLVSIRVTDMGSVCNQQTPIAHRKCNPEGNFTMSVTEH